MEANNSENGIFDALLPQESAEVDQPNETSAVESEEVNTESDIVETEDSTDVEASSEEVSEEASEDESSEDIVYDVGGKEYTLKQLEELEQGNLRQADYTKKSQVNAQELKETQAKKAELTEAVELVGSKVKELDELLASDSGIDMDYLRETDPSEYLKQKELNEVRQKASESAKADLQALEEREFQAKVATEQSKLLEAIPEWSDPAVLEADSKAINSYLEANGFTGEDTNDLVNHKVYVAIRKAALFDNLKSKSVETEKKVKAAPKVTKAGVKSNKKAETGINNAHSGLASALYS